MPNKGKMSKICWDYENKELEGGSQESFHLPCPVPAASFCYTEICDAPSLSPAHRKGLLQLEAGCRGSLSPALSSTYGATAPPPCFVAGSRTASACLNLRQSANPRSLPIRLLAGLPSLNPQTCAVFDTGKASCTLMRLGRFSLPPS